MEPFVLHGGVLVGCTTGLLLPGLSRKGDISKMSDFWVFGLMLN